MNAPAILIEGFTKRFGTHVAVDDLTLALTLSQPTPYLLSLLTHPATFPIHPPSVAEHGDGFARPGSFVRVELTEMAGYDLVGRIVAPC